ncbi:MAG TPA: MFS transporter [Stellaceae bacterium]|nr:MFS transporter [Stellaceae bacterium]
MQGFRDHRAGVEFWLLSLATFLCFTTVSQTALLARVMERHGLPLTQIGIVLSVYGAAVIVFMLVAAPVAARLGNLATLRLGIVLLLAGHLSYQLTIGDYLAAVLSRLLQGAGYGLFMPTAMTFAKGKLTKERFVYLFGIYASMVPLPNAVGPPLAEAYLDAFGEHLFFVVGAGPGIVAALLTLALTDDGAASERGQLPLLPTALLPGLRQPLIAIMVVGAIYGLIPSYMASLLKTKAVPLGFFFTSFTVVLFAARFTLVRYLETWTRRRVVAMGLAAMATSYLVIAHATGTVPVTLAGVAFGLGYSVAYPVLSVWVAEQFDAKQRTTPIALFNAMFSAGILLTPWFGTYVIGVVGYGGLLEVLACAGLLLTAALLLASYAGRPVATRT